MAAHNDLGRWGEEQAARYLESKGWFIRHRDWRNVHRDIDIVAIDEDASMLLIVEVKTRSTDAFGEPDIAITLEKKNNIIRATSAYLSLYRLYNLPVRYDTISIVGSPDSPVAPKITHKEDAFDIVDQFYFYEQKRKRARYKKRPGCW